MNWQRVKIEKLGRIVTGKTPKTADKDNYNGNIMFVTPSDNMDAKYIYSTRKTITEKGKNSVKGSIIPAGSVCVSCIGSDLGKAVITTEECITNQQINSIIVNTDKYDIDFVYYSMLILGKELNFHSKSSTAVPIVNKTSFSSYEINCPSLEEQKKIASMLSSIDEKIENNEAINKNLEQQAMALFKACFVDYSPFQGQLPSDWHEYKLGDFFPVITGKKNANVSSDHGQYPFFSCSQDIAWTDEYSFEGNAILVAGNGDFNVKFYSGKFEAYQRTYVLIPYNARYTAWLYYAVKHNLSNITLAARGSVIKFITKGNLEDFSFYAPADLEGFNVIDHFSAINNLIAEKREENSKLAQLRDVLLPKLMSGELDVSRLDI